MRFLGFSQKRNTKKSPESGFYEGRLTRAIKATRGVSERDSKALAVSRSELGMGLPRCF